MHPRQPVGRRRGECPSLRARVETRHSVERHQRGQPPGGRHHQPGRAIQPRRPVGPGQLRLRLCPDSHRPGGYRRLPRQYRLPQRGAPYPRLHHRQGPRHHWLGSDPGRTAAGERCGPRAALLARPGGRPAQHPLRAIRAAQGRDARARRARCPEQPAERLRQGRPVCPPDPGRPDRRRHRGGPALPGDAGAAAAGAGTGAGRRDSVVAAARKPAGHPRLGGRGVLAPGPGDGGRLLRLPDADRRPLRLCHRRRVGQRHPRRHLHGRGAQFHPRLRPGPPPARRSPGTRQRPAAQGHAHRHVRHAVLLHP